MRIEAFANPSVLAWARRMAGLEREDAARKAGVKPERLGDWEKGRLRPTITQLRKLADIYKRPLAVFFLEKPPPDEAPPSDFRRFDPTAAEPLSPGLRVVIRHARARREAALELFEELEERPPEFGLAANLSDDPEKVGARLRDVLAGRDEPVSGQARAVFNFWHTAVEGAGVLVFQAEHIDVGEMRGLSISERPLPAVVLNIKDAPSARSFSLLHELAHVLLNRGGLCVLEEGGPQTDVQRTEVFCNHVAGAALIPRDLLLGDPETPRRFVRDLPEEALTSLAHRYGASPEAVLRRLVILNRVAREFYEQKRQQYQRQYQNLRQRPTAGFVPPHTMAVARAGGFFTRLVFEAYDSYRITASDVSELLGVRLRHLEKIRVSLQQARTDIGEPP
jgi:Zn-dependent peptidase ImmA (M78 family)/transcriptional regulator with XRE-family HTH domain